MPPAGTGTEGIEADRPEGGRVQDEHAVGVGAEAFVDVRCLKVHSEVCRGSLTVRADDANAELLSSERHVTPCISARFDEESLRHHQVPGRAVASIQDDDVDSIAPGDQSAGVELTVR